MEVMEDNKEVVEPTNIHEDDKEIDCVECGRPFVFNKAEQDFYEEKHFVTPKRCRVCRDARKKRYADRGNA